MCQGCHEAEHFSLTYHIFGIKSAEGAGATIQGDTGKSQAFAYCFGYIQALIQLVNQES